MTILARRTATKGNFWPRGGGGAAAAAVPKLIAMNQIIANVVKPAWQESLSSAQRQASHTCALALLGGQFADLRSALGDPEFHDVSVRLVTETLESLRQDEFVSAAAKQREVERRQQQIEDLLEATGGDMMAARCDVVWLEQIFEERLMTRADRHAIDGGISTDEIRVFTWCFELAAKDDRRYWSYAFQYAVHADLVAASDDGTARGDKALHSLAARIFGDAAYCSKQIKTCFAKGLTERPDRGRPTSFPRAAESVLFRYLSMLRLNDIAVYK